MLYAIAHPLVWLFARLFFRLKVIGEENVPRTGGVIVAANHNSFLDIPLIGCALTRRADNMAKEELYRNPIVAAFFRALGGFSVRRKGNDRAALDEAVRRLRAGHLLVLYPEGTRSMDGRLRAPKAGIGMLVARTGAPVVPACIEGTDRAFPPGKRWIRPARVTITFGRPIDFGPLVHLGEGNRGANQGESRKETYLAVAREVMRRIGELRLEKQNEFV
jgi:1-acyl-sn-glycerol-3-phosphate acyltransferase